MTSIYSLNDPITLEIRYIGQTIDMVTRLYGHINDKHKTHKVNWIKSLKNKGLKPTINLIQEVPNEEASKWEIFYISFFKNCGFDLTNLTDGGEPGNFKKGHKHSPETRLKIKEARAKQVIPKGKDSPHYGKKHTPEHVAKVVAKLIGRPCSAEAKAKIGKANKANLTGRVLTDQHKKNIAIGLAKKKLNN
jgi:group I intron endonuclease